MFESGKTRRFVLIGPKLRYVGRQPSRREFLENDPGRARSGRVWRASLAPSFALDDPHGIRPQHYQGTDDQQLDRIGVYFTEVEARATDAAKYVPRSVQLDLESGVTSRVRSPTRRARAELTDGGCEDTQRPARQPL